MTLTGCPVSATLLIAANVNEGVDTVPDLIAFTDQSAFASRGGSANESRVLLSAPTPTPCPGDADGNGAVNFSDVIIVLGNFGNVGVPHIPGDADGNGVVNFADVTSVLASFGNPCP